jgi:hypothetical protein
MENFSQAPLVIGGIGGSGTRVVARVVRRAGYFLGTNLTGAEDAVEFWDFYDRWINRYLLCKEVVLSAEEMRAMNSDWSVCVGRHRKVIPSDLSMWGWKNPRSILLLGFLHQQYPDMKFIHVVRDGRDMAFSETARDQLRMHGAAILRGRLDDASEATRIASFWARINLQSLEYETCHMANRHLILKFEDLCMNPVETVERILNFSGGEPGLNARQIADDLVVRPLSIGRWKQVATEEIAVIQERTEDALRTFGYF